MQFKNIYLVFILFFIKIEAHFLPFFYDPVSLSFQNSACANNGLICFATDSQIRGLSTEVCDWQMFLYGYANGVFDHQGGKRSSNSFYSSNLIFSEISKIFCDEKYLSFRAAFSFEPGTIGSCGYPLLFSAAGTANCVTLLLDRFKARCFFTELSFTYDQLINDKEFYVYAGLPGEPALGPLQVQRISAFYFPEGSLTFPWFDSTRTCFGVINLGFQLNSLFWIEGSAFNGRLPNENLWEFKKPYLDSGALRASFISDYIIGQVSFGYLRKPDQLMPKENISRFTGSLTFLDGPFEVTFAAGVNKFSSGSRFDCYLLESSYIGLNNIFYGRFESIEADEFGVLEEVAQDKHRISKIAAGYTYQFDSWNHILFSSGFCLNFNFVPDALKPVYGNNPFSYFLFFRFELV